MTFMGQSKRSLTVHLGDFSEIYRMLRFQPVSLFGGTFEIYEPKVNTQHPAKRELARREHATDLSKAEQYSLEGEESSIPTIEA